MDREPRSPIEDDRWVVMEKISNALRWVREIPNRHEHRLDERQAVRLGVRAVFLAHANEWLTKSSIADEVGFYVSEANDGLDIKSVFEVYSFIDNMFSSGIIERRASYMGATLLEKVGEEPIFYRDEATAIDGRRMDVKLNRTPMDIDEMRMKNVSWTALHYRYSRDDETGHSSAPLNHDFVLR